MYAVPIGCNSTEPIFRCNGIRECSDGSDEENCSKFPIHFATRVAQHLLLVKCIVHNTGGSYISTLRYLLTVCILLHTVSCQSGAFQCNNGTCILSSRRCDGNEDCTDGSDETGCGRGYKLWLLRGIHAYCGYNKSESRYCHNTKVAVVTNYSTILLHSFFNSNQHIKLLRE